MYLPLTECKCTQKYQWFKWITKQSEPANWKKIYDHLAPFLVQNLYSTTWDIKKYCNVLLLCWQIISSLKHILPPRGKISCNNKCAFYNRLQLSCIYHNHRMIPYILYLQYDSFILNVFRSFVRLNVYHSSTHRRENVWGELMLTGT